MSTIYYILCTPTFVESSSRGDSCARLSSFTVSIIINKEWNVRTVIPLAP